MSVDLPIDLQLRDETGLCWVFVDEAKDPTVVVPGATLVAGEDADTDQLPVLVRVVDIAGAGADARAHLEILGPILAADLNFETDEPGVILARTPAAGAPRAAAVLLAGTRTAWSWVQVVNIDADGWLQLRLLTATQAARLADLRRIAADAAPRWQEPYRSGEHGDLLYGEDGLPDGHG